MSRKIIDFLGSTHASFIHAKGQKATEELITSLDCRANEKVLEIGFGTAATLTKLASIHKDTIFYGVNVSKVMYKKARQRIKFCGLNHRINLQLSRQNGKLPFENNSFDRVYIESVLAIQEGNHLKAYFLDIQRVLKPEGVLVFNETIWLETTDLKTIKTINQNCKNAFGIIQSNARFPYVQNWSDLLTSLKFQLIKLTKVDDPGAIINTEKWNFRQFLSSVFTAFGKVKFRLSPSLQKEWNTYNKTMGDILPGHSPLMEGVIMKVVNRK